MLPVPTRLEPGSSDRVGSLLSFNDTYELNTKAIAELSPKES